MEDSELRMYMRILIKNANCYCNINNLLIKHLHIIENCRIDLENNSKYIGNKCLFIRNVKL